MSKVIKVNTEIVATENYQPEKGDIIILGQKVTGQIAVAYHSSKSGKDFYNGIHSVIIQKDGTVLYRRLSNSFSIFPCRRQVEKEQQICPTLNFEGNRLLKIGRSDDAETELVGRIGDVKTFVVSDIFPMEIRIAGKDYDTCGIGLNYSDNKAKINDDGVEFGNIKLKFDEIVNSFSDLEYE